MQTIIDTTKLTKFKHYPEGLLVQGDCLEVMPLIADKSIDCIIADLPYGMTACHWDSVIPLEKLWEQYKRIIKDNGAVVLFGSQPFTSKLVISNLKWFKCEWIWNKTKASGFLSVRIRPMKIHESILIFGKNKLRYNPQMEYGKPYYKKGSKNRLTESYGKFNPLWNNSNTGERFPTSIIKFDNCNYNGIGLHPTQKPTSLIEYLIKTYTDKDDIILDNTFGSGTTCIAAVQTSRRFIGIEKEEKYYDICVERLKNVQLSLL